MGLSRRQFTREFKLAALQRLEMGASVAEVARAVAAAEVLRFTRARCGSTSAGESLRAE